MPRSHVPALQEEVSGGTTSLILSNLDTDTVYNVAVVPVYPDVEGIVQADKGKTSKCERPRRPSGTNIAWHFMPVR